MEWINPPKLGRCHLLDLPAELRDLIYEYAVTSDKTIVTFRLDKYQRDSYNQAVQPSLTRVNRQVRAESLPFYYACNTFVLHTEASKALDARRWLLCNEMHLLKLRRLSLWIRYVPLTNHRTTSQGALSITVLRNVADGCWKVDDGWDWITVVRRPGALEDDANFLIGKVRSLLVNESTSHLSAEEFADLLVQLRLEYVKEKMG
ncbi:hypothetical protein EJ03DRAFT_134 [Teratosphaeria nubilosa]|uniref:2EXR domain-containing protein n=1 Tax=Teratosphaeria nubilosa TaxID=161662 RepID=A0A6G1LPM4_9PEZI|nr:hypothetical protein EJ03DRAFT_134 [Teratosphaeria nubilosa]